MVLATKDRIIASRSISTERYILSTMPVLYLPLHRLDSGSSGGKFISADGIGHVCTVTGALLSQGGRLFDGDDKISVAQVSALENLSAKSVFVWFNAPGFTGTFRYVYDSGYDEANFGTRIFLTNNSDGVQIWVKNSEGDLAAKAFDFAVNTWEFVGFSWDGTTVHYYRNAVEQDTGDALDATLACTDKPTHYGSIAAGNSVFFTGNIGEGWIYNRALTPQEVQGIYIATNWRYK